MQIATVDATHRQPGDETLDVPHRLQRIEQPFEVAAAADQFCNGPLATKDRLDLHQGSDQPLTKEPGTHRRSGPVEMAEK